MERIPVLVGIGVATQREDDFTRAKEPVDLMLDAVRSAGRDAGAAAALPGVEYIAVPRGRWAYANPAGAIARAIGAPQATTVLASVGVLQQTLIGAACERIARGMAQTTLVVGGDAGDRLLRAQIAGIKPDEQQQRDPPHIQLAPKDELRHPVEKAAGLKMPVGLYAIIESAFRAKQRWSVTDHRDRLAALYAQMSAIAAANPHAWNRKPIDAATIREPAERNPMQAFPYTRWHCSQWNVDQAAALLFCSAARAEMLGIPRERWIYPLASTESNHMVPVSARDDLAACPGARIAGRAALAAAGLSADDLDLVELYSCFPIAVELYAQELGIVPSRPLTVTGGMPFAGGPYNNYVLQATCRAAELLRGDDALAHPRADRRSALVSSVSGILTKQGFGLWSTQPSETGFVNDDVTGDVSKTVREREVIAQYTGPARIAGCTVLQSRGERPRAVAIVDTPRGQRTIATTTDADWIARIESDECVGRDVRVDSERLIG
jgi:acetyl-CoA C-acetyltransferase